MTPAHRTIYRALFAAPPPLVAAVFRRKTTVNVLRGVMMHPDGISHDSLSSLGSDKGIQKVRSFLVDQGVLSPRDELLALFEGWLDSATVGIQNAADRQMLVLYARWKHLRRLRLQTEATTLGQLSGARRELLLVLEFFAWLHRGGIPLGDIDQRVIDHWLKADPARNAGIRYFLRWATRNKATNSVVLPPPPRFDLGVTGDTKGWEEVLATLLDPTSPISGADRLAGSLVVLFGVWPSRIIELRLSDITPKSRGFSIMLGTDPLDLPDELTAAVTETLEARQAPRLFGPSQDQEWLFPGNVAGRSLSRDAMIYRLRKLGIEVKGARRAALRPLAAQLPAPVLARLTGVNISTAHKWRMAVSASDANYVGARRRQCQTAKQ